MSPEQALAAKIWTRAADLFSFGVVLYEMATGVLPFNGASVPGDLRRHPEQGPRRAGPRQSGSARSRMEGIIQKALQKDRELRYQSASE